MYGIIQPYGNQRKYPDHHHGYHSNYLLLHRRSEIRTLDRLYPGSVLLVGVTFGLIFLIAHLDGGIGAIFHEMSAGHKFLAVDQPIFNANILKDSVFLMIVGAGFNTMGSYVSSQDIVQRFTTTTDTKKLNKMMLTNGGLSIFIATVFYLIGTGLYVFYQVQGNQLPPAAQQDQIFASWIAFELPVGITGLLLAAIYAAAQSTLSTGLNSVASSWTLDIQARLSKKELSFEKQTKIGQYVSLLVGIFSIVVAMVLANGGVKSAYEWFNGFMGLVLGILIGTFILGAFTKLQIQPVQCAHLSLHPQLWLVLNM